MDRFVDYYGAEVCNEKPFYNFGAGNWRHPHFQNIDLVHPNYPNNKPDIEYDALSLNPLPIKSGSAKIFYFSHVNEHLPDNINTFLFTEMYRCLEPGGLIRFVFPDLNLANRAHQENDRSFFLRDWWRGQNASDLRADHEIGQLWLDYFATRAQEGSPNDGNKKYTAAQVEEMILADGYEKAAADICAGLSLEAQRKAPGCHMNYWTPAKFERFCAPLGFDVCTSAYGQSVCPPLRDTTYFDKNMPVLSGYVDAIKAV